MAHNCEYCGQMIEDNLEKCPNCGAVNSNYQRAAITQPKTIEELKEWYKEKNLPPEETTRFFIGKDHRAAKCYGIYQDPDTKKFIVYKFKADGTRAVRYEGDDEAYAVNEIFQKLREVIAVQKGMNAVDSKYGKSTSVSSRYTGKRKRSSLKTYLIIVLCVWLTGALATIGLALSGCDDKHPERDKYYQYDDEYYYNFNGKYYRYDEDEDDWNYYGTNAPFDEEEYEDYEIDRGSYDVGNFHDSDVYQDWYDSQQNDSYDSNDSDWDSGWDSGDSWDSDYGSDWDSDW